jgi:putative membrane protein
MLELVIRLVVNAVAVMVAARVISGVEVKGFASALLTAVVLAVLNTFLKPVLLFLTFPINFITLGLFTLVINAVIIMIADAMLDGFKVGGFVKALIFSFALWVINGVMNFFFGL